MALRTAGPDRQLGYRKNQEDKPVIPVVAEKESSQINRCPRPECVKINGFLLSLRLNIVAPQSGESPKKREQDHQVGKHSGGPIPSRKAHPENIYPIGKYDALLRRRADQREV